MSTASSLLLTPVDPFQALVNVSCAMSKFDDEMTFINAKGHSFDCKSIKDTDVNFDDILDNRILVSLDINWSNNPLVHTVVTLLLRLNKQISEYEFTTSYYTANRGYLALLNRISTNKNKHNTGICCFCKSVTQFYKFYHYLFCSFSFVFLSLF